MAEFGTYEEATGAALAEEDLNRVVAETTEPPVPFPDHDIGTVAAITGALAALATGNPDLRGPALTTLEPWELDIGGEGYTINDEWMAALADTVTWLLAVHGVEPDQLWAAYFALSERITGTGEGT